LAPVMKIVLFMDSSFYVSLNQFSGFIF